MFKFQGLARALLIHYSYRPNPILIENRRWDPVTGLTSSLLGTSTNLVDATSGIFLKPAAEYRKGRGRSMTPSGSSTNSRPQSRQSSTAGSTPGATTFDRDAETIDDSASESTATLKQPIQATTRQADRDEKTVSHPNVAASMALASTKSLGKVFSAYTKGVLVDMPLATAEGFRSLPRLWGDEVADYGKVTDWKSGAVVAGKSFALGIGDGFKDLARQPAEGMAKEGAWGAIKGVAKGSGSLVTKTVSGSLGLFAYPGQGITKSLWALGHGETGRRIVEARREEGKWRAGGVDQKVRQAVLREYYNVNVGGR